MGGIRFVPMGRGRYRRIYRKKKTDTKRRKPISPPLQFPSKEIVDFRSLAAGAGVEARMDARLEALIDSIDKIL